MNHIDKTSQKFRQNIEVLHFQKKLQTDRDKFKRYMGRSDFFTVKAEFHNNLRTKRINYLKKEKLEKQI